MQMTMNTVKIFTAENSRKNLTLKVGVISPLSTEKGSAVNVTALANSNPRNWRTTRSSY